MKIDFARLLRHILSFALLLPVLALLLGWLGFLHPAGDSFAIFRPQLILLAIASTLLLYFFARPYLAATASVVVIAAILSLVGYRSPAFASTGSAFDLYQKNLSFRLASVTDIVEDILEQEPHFLSLQEVTARNRPLLDEVASRLPFHLVCAFASVGAVAVASHYPIIEGSEQCADKLGFAAIQVDSPSGPIWVVSIHLHWPWPFGQPEQLAALTDHLALLDGPVIIGGDFNMVPWSHALKTLQRQTETDVVGGLAGTYPMFGNAISLPIDHILVPRGSVNAEIARRTLLGSDHLGLVARFEVARDDL